MDALAAKTIALNKRCSWTRTELMELDLNDLREIVWQTCKSQVDQLQVLNLLSETDRSKIVEYLCPPSIQTQLYKSETDYKCPRCNADARRIENFIRCDRCDVEVPITPDDPFADVAYLRSIGNSTVSMKKKKYKRIGHFSDWIKRINHEMFSDSIQAVAQKVEAYVESRGMNRQCLTPRIVRYLMCKMKVTGYLHHAEPIASFIRDKKEFCKPVFDVVLVHDLLRLFYPFEQEFENFKRMNTSCRRKSFFSYGWLLCRFLKMLNLSRLIDPDRWKCELKTVHARQEQEEMFRVIQEQVFQKYPYVYSVMDKYKHE